MNLSPWLFMDLPISVVTLKNVVTISKVATKKLLRMLGTSSRLIDFAYVVTIDELLMWEEVIKRQDVDEWKKATDGKYRAVMKNETWDLTKLLKGRKIIRNKWIFHIKRRANGDIDKYQARLVAKGFSQTKRLNFNETFTLVMKFLSIMMSALAAILDLEIHQMDIKSAFLNGCVEEDIYMM